jgi:hypothetical protein
MTCSSVCICVVLLVRLLQWLNWSLVTWHSGIVSTHYQSPCTLTMHSDDRHHAASPLTCTFLVTRAQLKSVYLVELGSSGCHNTDIVPKTRNTRNATEVREHSDSWKPPITRTCMCVWAPTIVVPEVRPLMSTWDEHKIRYKLYILHQPGPEP